MDMNSPKGKEILALVRNADYAHAGEEEAIDIVFKNIPKDRKRLLLDVGCGRGGTAQYIQHNGWGKVTGVDLDAESIRYAKKSYPDIEFVAGDVTKLSKCLTRRFDIIYLFNVFYALPDHLYALKQLYGLSLNSGRIIIFDYCLKADSRENFPFKDWNPLSQESINSTFAQAGWRVVKVDDISALYEKWYRNLVSRIERKSDSIITVAGKEWLDFVLSFYGRIVGAIEKKLLGGVVVYADKEGNGS